MNWFGRWRRSNASDQSLPAQEGPASPFAGSSWADLGDLYEYRKHRVLWPRVYHSAVWVDDLEPFYKKALVATFLALEHETDPQKIVRLQERAKLIHEWLDLPIRAKAMEESLLSNLYGQNPRDGRDPLMEEIDRQERQQAQERAKRYAGTV